MPQGLEVQLREVVLATVKDAMDQHQKSLLSKNWMSLKEGADYANVSYNTFIKFRKLGLKVCEIDGVRRISKKEIDAFLENNSY
ncbi:DNA-binding protein [Sporosarcina sp. P17b]|nr:DNA-binding protein [Sporosarcina sp. P17b]